MKGITLYRGPSVLDGEPIICIATLNTLNMKTGPMIQTWILREDVDPNVAVKLGKDSSVCGKCVHRHFNKGSCYVMPFQAPNQVFKAYHRGLYPALAIDNLHYLMGRHIRLGSYGDPAAVPYHIWLSVVALSDGHTGYTHQMGHACFDHKILEYCQVSVETPAQFKKMQALGLGTFRVKAPEAPILDNEIVCLSDASNIPCISCGLCNGKSGNNVVINVHGSRSVRFLKKFGSKIDVEVID